MTVFLTLLVNSERSLCQDKLTDFNGRKGFSQRIVKVRKGPLIMYVAGKVDILTSLPPHRIPVTQPVTP